MFNFFDPDCAGDDDNDDGDGADFPDIFLLFCFHFLCAGGICSNDPFPVFCLWVGGRHDFLRKRGEGKQERGFFSVHERFL